ncbi:Tra5 Transposase and inactivated derivatives [Burkholderiaceae bacterium]
MIDPTHKLSISRQAKALGIARSTVYFKPAPISDSDLALMSAMDRLHLDYPFAGARMLRDLLRHQGSAVGRARVTRLMRKMGIEATYRKSNTSQRNFAHKVYPYLLRNLTIDRVNQVWAMDITYLPMKRGFLYLAAVIDWLSRKILSFRLSNTMHTDFCIEAVHEAIQKYGVPEIMNTDQGSQFTSLEFTAPLKSHHIQISMDGKCCWRDNVIIERFWRTVKYEEVYLKAYQTTSEARTQLTQYIRFYNEMRGHQALNGQTPDSVYFNYPFAAKAA